MIKMLFEVIPHINEKNQLYLSADALSYFASVIKFLLLALFDSFRCIWLN